MSEDRGNNVQTDDQMQALPGAEPIEPGKTAITKLNVVKWILFLLIIIYALVSFFQAPILTGIGKYLIVEHTPERSDLIVCLAGGNIESPGFPPDHRDCVNGITHGKFNSALISLRS